MNDTTSDRQEQGAWHEILCADDDTVSTELLEWCGLLDIWMDSELDEEYDFLEEVEVVCTHMEVIREEWDADFPGHSGTMCRIATDNEAELKAELAAALSALIQENSSEPE